MGYNAMRGEDERTMYPTWFACVLVPWDCFAFLDRSPFRADSDCSACFFLLKLNRHIMGPSSVFLWQLVLPASTPLPRHKTRP